MAGNAGKKTQLRILTVGNEAQSGLQSRLLNNRGKSIFGGSNPGPSFASGYGKGGDVPSTVRPAPVTNDADLWEGWRITESIAPEPVKPRAPTIASYAAELQDECDDEDEDEDEEELPLSEEELSEICRNKQIPLRRIENAKRAIGVIRQFDLFGKASISTLKNEYKKRGFAPPDGSMRKEDLLSRVKEVVIWENLRLEELRQVCAQQSLQAKEALSRAELMQLLADASWLARGIPVQQLPNMVVAHGVLDSVDALSSKSLADLVAHCKRLGLPLEAKPEKDDIVPRIRTALIWKQMDDASLYHECVKRGAPLDAVTPPKEQAEHHAVGRLVGSRNRSARTALDRLLLQSLWLDVWKSAGICVKTLGTYVAAAQLFRQIEKLRVEDFKVTQKKYRDLDLPLEQQDDVRFVNRRVSESLFWQALSLPDLVGECSSRNISIDGHDTSSESRHKLVKQLALDSCIRAWVEMGIPVDRLTSASSAASIAEEWRKLESISDADLKIKCELHGVPADAIHEQRDLVQLIRDAAVWEALPVKELEKETAKLIGTGNSSSSSADAADAGLDAMLNKPDEFTRQNQLVEMLLLDRCAETYEAKGIPAKRLGSLKAAAKFAEQIKELEAKDTESLKQDCRSLGLPTEHLQRQELLDVRRDVALWQALPLSDLRLECRARNVACPAGSEHRDEKQQRALLVDALLVQRCEAWYENRGIPVGRLASVQAAARVAERWQQLESMTEGGLVFKASSFSIHVEKDVARQEILDRVKMAILWSELPLNELQRVCRNHGVNSIGREDQKREMLHRLTSTLWAPKPPPPPPEPKPRKTTEEQYREWQRTRNQGGHNSRDSQGGYGPNGKVPHHPPPPKMQSIPPKIAGHFKTLGLPSHSTAADVKKAYRRLALKYHPDKNLEASKEEASRRFREVADAYSSLMQHFGGCR
eukprot:TRINITY_DN6831_c0_g1_i1.p1 TRINITY_DN6831_c0_g1~~TRINITY_DN6831_c0_g1_i1.p1  ORF type:complete len:932 (-),score=159.25 TRINITY_DN6831_c0_g1_i1:237-3032(-)